MPRCLPEIIYDKTKITPVIDAETSLYKIPYFKDIDYFSNMDSYVNFVKGVEKAVRTNDRYKKYISYLKKEIKLNRCQVLKNVTDEDFDNSGGIEMHHGPIFNLFDYCAIILEYFIIKHWKISTARVADVVLNEHQMNRIQVVMLSESMHELVHAKKIFINHHQAYGDLNAFLDKYRCALTEDMIEKLNRYIDRCLLMDSSDFGVLKLNPELTKKS